MEGNQLYFAKYISPHSRAAIAIWKQTSIQFNLVHIVERFLFAQPWLYNPSVFLLCPLHNTSVDGPKECAGGLTEVD